MIRALFVVCILCVPAAAPCQEPVAKTSAPDVRAEIRALEQQMWENWRVRQFDAMETRIARDAQLLGSGGRQSREQVISAMRAERCDVKRVSMEDVIVSLPTPTVAVITYRSRAEGSCNGTPIPALGDINTSVWARQGGRWLTILHHQSVATK